MDGPPGRPPPASRPGGRGLGGSQLLHQVMKRGRPPPPPGYGAVGHTSAGLPPLGEAGAGAAPPEPAAAGGGEFRGVLGWDRFFDAARDVRIDGRGTFRVYLAGDAGPVVFLLHGGGYTGLTWALVARELKGRCRLAALDMRGHGETSTEDDADLSAARLAEDAVAVWAHLFAAERPPTFLVGHSVGGAVATWAAKTQRIPSLAGLAVIDVVEGTALASLVHMQQVLAKRPPLFKSVEAAVRWALKTKMTKNAEAAAVSLPSQLAATEKGHFRWRTPLEETEPFWRGWYTGLSAAFLSAPAAKLLLLAGTDRLDKELMIGQMQGRFQMQILPAGHTIQEDEAPRVSAALLGFVQRFGKPVPVFAKATPAAAGTA